MRRGAGTLTVFCAQPVTAARESKACAFKGGSSLPCVKGRLRLVGETRVMASGAATVSDVTTTILDDVAPGNYWQK